MILAAYNLGPVIPVTSPHGTPLFGIPIIPFLAGGLILYTVYRVIKKQGTLGDKLEEIPIVWREILELVLSRGQLPPRAASLVQQALATPAIPAVQIPPPPAPAAPALTQAEIAAMILQAQAAYNALKATAGKEAEASQAAALYNKLKALQTPPAAGTVP